MGSVALCGRIKKEKYRCISSDMCYPTTTAWRCLDQSNKNRTSRKNSSNGYLHVSCNVISHRRDDDDDNFSSYYLYVPVDLYERAWWSYRVDLTHDIPVRDIERHLSARKREDSNAIRVHRRIRYDDLATSVGKVGIVSAQFPLSPVRSKVTKNFHTRRKEANERVGGESRPDR